MRLKNYTDIPNDSIKYVIRFVRPPAIAGFDVKICNSTRYARGMAYASGHSYHDRACPFINISIPRTERGARHKTTSRKGYLGVWLGSREECLVFLLAHELRHLWQGKVKRGYRVWGARGQFSERDADAYALGKLRQWRRKPSA